MSSSTPVVAIDAVAIDAVATNTVVAVAPANTVAVKKLKKVRVPTTQALEATTAVESGSTAAAVTIADAKKAADAKKVKKVRVQPIEAEAESGSGSGSVVPEKKKRVVKKPQEKEAAAVTEVVQMVADMKTAFTEATQTQAATVDDVATVDDDADAELVLDTYVELDGLDDDFELLQLQQLVDSELVDFDALRLDGDETPCCAFNPIPDPIQEEPIQEESVAAVAAVAAVAIRPVRPVFRFEFSSECFDLLNGFAHENLGVPRKEYKAKWEQFATDHAEFVAQESARLADAGYDGDVLAKMFKTVKYYLTKRVKQAATTASAVVEQVDEVTEVDDDDATVDAEPQGQGQDAHRVRRHYTTLDRAVLEAMDSHITSSISSNSKPATCYASFCDQFRNSVETELARLVRYDHADDTAAFTFTEKTAEEKLKKTYKNRMFLQIRNM